MVHLGDSSNDIWHSTFNGKEWTPNIRIPNQRSKASPALAESGGLLHMVHLGDSSARIWHAVLINAWEENVIVPGQMSKTALALATFFTESGTLFQMHVVHLGESSNSIWHSYLRGES
jgi:hypothetical protein